MKWFRFRKKKARFPWWFNEHIRGNLKARVGQDLGPTGEPEVVVQFLFREDWKWKTIGTFRYLDFPYLNELRMDVEKYLRAMIVS